MKRVFRTFPTFRRRRIHVIWLAASAAAFRP